MFKEEIVLIYLNYTIGKNVIFTLKIRNFFGAQNINFPIL